MELLIHRSLPSQFLEGHVVRQAAASQPLQAQLSIESWAMAVSMRARCSVSRAGRRGRRPTAHPKVSRDRSSTFSSVRVRHGLQRRILGQFPGGGEAAHDRADGHPRRISATSQGRLPRRRPETRFRAGPRATHRRAGSPAPRGRGSARIHRQTTRQWSRIKFSP